MSRCLSLGSRAEHRHQRGLTLIELLVAMTLLGLMLTVMFGSLYLSSRSWDSTAASIAHTEDRRLAINFIRRALEWAAGAPIQTDKGRQLLFDGRSDAVEFVSEMPHGVGLSGQYLLRLFVDHPGPDGRLILEYRLFHPEILAGIGPAPKWSPLIEERHVPALRESLGRDIVASPLFGQRVLVEQVRAVHFRYWIRGLLNGAEHWSDKWELQRRLPTYVSMDLEGADGVWPEMTVALPSTGYSPEAFLR
jgi:general secretion pathway protein J